MTLPEVTKALMDHGVLISFLHDEIILDIPADAALEIGDLICRFGELHTQAMHDAFVADTKAARNLAVYEGAWGK